MDFKDRLREEIEFKGLLGKEIAAKVGISYSTFLSYIDSRSVLPNVETAVKIAKVLGVSVEYLVTGEDSLHTEKNKHLRDLIKDLSNIDEKTLLVLKTMIHALVQRNNF